MRYLPAACLLLGVHASYAQDTTLDPVIVTATRTAQTVDETLASVTVITREEIERRQALSVQDVLRGVAGLTIANSGGLGKATAVFLRGTEPDHVLVLVDGIRIGSATLGTAPFQEIPSVQIERIEIVRGPRSSLYGSEAIGGVIQIFTRKGNGPRTPWFSVGAGNDQTYQVAAGLSGGGAHHWYNASLSALDTEGFNACRGQPSVGGCLTLEPDDDGYRNLSSALRAGYRSHNGTEIDVHWLHAESENEFDGSDVNESTSVQQVLGSRLRFSPAELWQVMLVAGRSWDESDNFLNGSFKSRFDTERDVASLQNDIAVGADHLLTLGIDYEDERVDSTTAFAMTSRANKGIFVQHQGVLGPRDIQLALRYDDNEQFGRHATGGLALGYTFVKDKRFMASYGTAFRAPTFNELYFPGFGNPDLEPEESQSIELGVRGAQVWGNWSFNAYQTEVDDLIAFDAATIAPVNIDSARIRGLEAIVSAIVSGWVLSLDLTLLEPENRSSDPHRGKVLPYRAEQTLRIDLDRNFRRYRLGATLFGEGRRYDDLANTRALGGYATLDLRAEYALAKDWRLQGRLGNLFDKDYETAVFFNQPGRTLFLTLHYQPSRH
jgi:vitamin B12 transporter